MSLYGDVPFDELVERIREDLQLWDSFFLGQSARFWTNWTDPALKRMLNSAHDTVAALADIEADVRLAAVSLIVSYWVARPLFAERCVQLAFTDTDSRVRGGAFQALFRHEMYLKKSTAELRKLLQLFLPKKRLGELDSQAEEALAAIESKRRERCRILAGAYFEDMRSGPERAEAYLKNPNPRLREGALAVISCYFIRSEQIVALCERLALRDPDAKVQSTALDLVIAHYDRTDDARIGAYLCAIVRHDHFDTALRRQAYEGLFVLRGMPISAMPSYLFGSGEFPFPGMVDWSFVGSFDSLDNLREPKRKEEER